MSKKATYQWGCKTSWDDYMCVIHYSTEEKARDHVRTCPGVLVVRREGSSQDWDEVVDLAEDPDSDKGTK